MINKIAFNLLISFITFCTVSYCSVMVSLLSSIGNPTRKPVSNIGFPYKYYYQFWLSGSDSPNCGWSFKAFFLDTFLTLMVVSVFYLIYERNNKMK